MMELKAMTILRRDGSSALRHFGGRPLARPPEGLSSSERIAWAHWFPPREEAQ
jgi:hypothetical protein